MKKLLLSILAVILATSMMGSVFAWFTDSAASEENTLTAGTLQLKLTDNDENWDGPPGTSTWGKDVVSTTWSMTNMEPGITFCPNGTVTLYNAGSIEADHVEISFSHDRVNYPGNPAKAAEMARWIEIETLGYDGLGDLKLHNFVPFTNNDPNNNGFFDLEDVTLSPWAGEGGILDGLGAPLPNYGTSKSFQMELSFNAGATNDVQGDTLITTVTFTLNQDSSQ